MGMEMGMMVRERIGIRGRMITTQQPSNPATELATLNQNQNQNQIR